MPEPHESLAHRSLVVKVRRLTDAARLPTRSHLSDAGWDLYAVDPVGGYLNLYPSDVRSVGTGVAVEIPPGFYGQIFGRSGLASRGIMILGGVIDSGYRGEIGVVLANVGHEMLRVEAGDRIAQLVILPVPAVEMVEAAELGESPRAADGFGSTGR
jgi:dUTP pyrophosphatase